VRRYNGTWTVRKKSRERMHQKDEDGPKKCKQRKVTFKKGEIISLPVKYQERGEKN